MGARTDWADILLRWWDRWLKEDASVRHGPTRRGAGLRAAVAQRAAVAAATDVERAHAVPRRRRDPAPAPDEDTATARSVRARRNRYVFLSGVGEHYNHLPPTRRACCARRSPIDVEGADLHAGGYPVARPDAGPRRARPATWRRSCTASTPTAQWHLLGWGASDLRFPNGEYEAQPVAAGQPIEMHLPLQPLDARRPRGRAAASRPRPGPRRPHSRACRSSRRAALRRRRRRAPLRHRGPEGEGLLRARGLTSRCEAPLPLRADGAARAAPEVQGLGARSRLVPGQPAGADGRVRARLQGPARRGGHPRLPGVPAGRADRLGLLRAGAPRRRAQPGAERAAGAQGALPARDHPGVGGDRAARHVPGDARAAPARRSARARQPRPGAAAPAA